MADLAATIYFFVARIFSVAVVQLIILLILNILSRRNVELSGVRMWAFYALEILVVFTPFLIIYILS